MMSSTLGQLRRMAEEPDGPDDHELFAVDDIGPLLDIVEAFARADMATAHSECPVCAGPRNGASTLGYDHYDNCTYLVARRLCGMEDGE